VLARPRIAVNEVRAGWTVAGVARGAGVGAPRADAIATLSAHRLSLKGVELIVERRWLREAFWRQAKQAITRGYIYRSSAVQVIVRGERREHERRNTPSRRAS